MNDKKKDNNRNKMISTKDIMSKHSLSYQTVNHYIDFSLLPIWFKKGNARFYNKNIVEIRLKKIRELIGEGYPLRLIRKKIVGI